MQGLPNACGFGEQPTSELSKRSATVLWGLVVLLLVFWVFGAFVANLGSIVHLVLVVAVILIVYNLVTRGKVAL